MKEAHIKIDAVIEELDNFDKKREKIIKLTRKLNRLSGRGIAQIVKKGEYETYLQQGRSLMLEINELMSDLAPVTSWSITNSGTEEYAEFEILLGIITQQNLPTPDALKVPSWIWISAVGDVIGEIRRMMLGAIIAEDLETAKTYLWYIQELYDAIIGLEFSKSLVPNLRRKVDIARTLIDKCESDFANAVINKKTKTS